MTVPTTGEPTVVLDARAELGECPVWAGDEQALYWVDIRGKALHRFDPATGADRAWPLPQQCGSFALRESGGAVLALVDGFYAFDFATGEATFLVGPDDQPPGTRFNDGKVSPDGRFFAGTMDEKTLREPIASLYRLDPDGSLHEVVDGLIVSNGLAWSADGATMFHSDSKGQVVWTYDYDAATGTVGEPPRARPAHRGDRPTRRRRRRRRGLLLELGDLGRRAQPLGARRVARPQHPPARVEPDLPLLRRPGPHDDLRDLAAPRPARRRARREAGLRRDRRAARSTSPGYPSPASRASPQSPSGEEPC